MNQINPFQTFRKIGNSFGPPDDLQFPKNLTPFSKNNFQLKKLIYFCSKTFSGTCILFSLGSNQKIMPAKRLASGLVPTVGPGVKAYGNYNSRHSKPPSSKTTSWTSPSTFQSTNFYFYKLINLLKNFGLSTMHLKPGG